MISAIDHTRFQEQYLSLRKKEGRLYTNEEIKLLPFVNNDHPLKNEWDIRSKSCKRLTNYLVKKKKGLQILEVGCGNGWLCHQLSKISQATVTGIDINETDLLQAKQVFPSLSFFYGDLREDITDKSFDIIVFAASFQYFKSATGILHCCFQHLEDDGEVHILDTNFYLQGEALKAAKRSVQYFTSSGCPQMSDYYFHRSWQDLDGFNFKVLYKPNNFMNRYFDKHPFPWICIKK